MDENMQKEPGELSPFQERVNVNLFFAGAQRRKILDGIKRAIIDGVPVITITGDEGTGKTMICRMVEKELPDNYACVYLPNTLESFDDVVRILALGLGTENSKNPGTTQALVIEISQYLQENNRRLVTLFDQAERMYLATLERIRKMLDQLNDQDVRLQIVMAGRKILLNNLKQLAICDFKEVEERNFRLEPLGLSETYAYLNHCVQQRTPARGKNVFTPEAAKKIYSMAQGNFRMTNMFAEKSLESIDSETSFMVLLENVCDAEAETGSPRKKAGKISALFPERLFSRKIVSGAVVLCLFSVAAYFFLGGEKENPDPAGPGPKSDKQVSSQVIEKPVAIAKPDLAEATGSVATLGKVAAENQHPAAPAKEESGKEQEPAATTDTAPTEPVTLSLEDGEIGSARREEAAVIPPSSLAEEITVVTAESAAEVVEERAATPAAADDTPDAMPDPVVEAPPLAAPEVQDETVDVPLPRITASKLKRLTAIPQAGNTGRQPAEGAVVLPSAAGADKTDTAMERTATDELALFETSSQQSADLQLPPDSVTSQSQGTDEVLTLLSEKRKRILQPQMEEGGAKKIVKIAPATLTAPDGIDRSMNRQVEENREQIYQQRVTAASKWFDGSSSDKHTVQLMMLTAEEAEDNLKKWLDEEQFRNIADDLYIIKNPQDATVFVYYGEYSDPDAARNARNTLPVFLRKYDPYTISVGNVIKKVTSQ